MSGHTGGPSRNQKSAHVWPGGGPENQELHYLIDVYWGRGLSDNQVAVAVGCSQRTVLRHRQSRELPANRPWVRNA